MGLLDRFLEKQLAASKEQITKSVTQDLIQHVNSSLSKGYTGESPFITGMAGGRGVKRFQFSQDMVNGGIQRRKKPGANISFETLRQFSINHEVSRACINYRKRQITGLEWTIATADPDDTGDYDNQKDVLKEFFKGLGGRGIGYRKFMDRFIEDLLVLDAISLEKLRSRGSALLNLIPIDAATIRLRVDESGATPEPPETAYVQVIRGQQTAEFTADELIYEMINPRNDSPYGLAPLESLMVIVTSSLTAGMYNLGYLTDGNIPEGFYTMPEGWQPNQIKEFQEYFDALMAGDATATSRLKFMPPGVYINPNKRDDMAFMEFNDWLMKITCALFEVSPSEIGFTPKTGLGGKGYGEQQQQSGENKGLLPLALFIEEIFTKIIQEDFGFTDLKFDFPTLREKDAKLKAEINAILLNSGQRTVDELRTNDGLDALGIDKPFVSGNITFIDEESRNADQAAKEALQNKLSNPTQEEKPPQPTGNTQPNDAAKSAQPDRERDSISLATELRTFRKYALGRAKAGKAIRKFESDILPQEVVDELNGQLQKAADAEEIRGIFHEYMQDYQINVMEGVQRLREQLKAV